MQGYPAPDPLMQDDSNRPLTPLTPISGTQWCTPTAVETVLDEVVQEEPGRILHSATKLIAIAEVEGGAIEPTERDKEEVGRALISVTSLDKCRQKFKKKRRVSPRAKW